LARRAGIGRNALYTNHRSVLDDLRDLQAARSPTQGPDAPPDKAGGKGDSDERVRVLATENASLLRRALIAETRAKRLEERNAGLARELNERRNLAVMSVRPSGDAEE
jgi:hypothetical protein